MSNVKVEYTSGATEATFRTKGPKEALKIAEDLSNDNDPSATVTVEENHSGNKSS